MDHLTDDFDTFMLASSELNFSHKSQMTIDLTICFFILLSSILEQNPQLKINHSISQTPP